MDEKIPLIKPYPPRARGTRGSASREMPANDWEIGVFGELTEKQPDVFQPLVEVPRNSHGTIYFDSCGGNTYVGLALATLIRLRGIRATGVVCGECSSAALLPFAACQRRFVTSHATLLFHPMRWQSEEEVRLEEAAEWARYFKVLEEDLDELLARLFDHPLEQLREWIRPGRFVTGKEFVEAGLANMVDLFSGDLKAQIAKANSQ